MLKRLFITLQLLLILLLAGCSVFQERLPLAKRSEVLSVQHIPSADTTLKDKQSLKVISLNMAHGRKLSFSQLFVSEETIRSNLLDIAEFLKREDADVVALQEADQASFWSGGFDHVEFIAAAAGFPWFVSAVHVDNSLATYGTAILSKVPIKSAHGFTFQPTPPTTNKGYSLIRIDWEVGNLSEGTGLSLPLDIVSVHLDFSRAAKRKAQLDELALTLTSRDNAAIILGDFNSEWLGKEKIIQAFAENGRFSAYRPEVDAFYSYSDKRLDWALISNELEFSNFLVADDVLSDHKAIIAHIRPINAGTLTAFRQED